MQVASMHFKERAHVKLHDARLQGNLKKMQGKFVAKRRASLVELDDFEGTRDAGKAIRNRALDNLDVWLEIFEQQRDGARRDGAVRARRRPTSTRWCSRSPRGTRVRKIIKSKSMVSEESALDHAIEAAGLTVVETDLGEYILQINNYEPPSHIIGPALHKSQGGGRRALPQGARHAAQDGHRGAVPRGARRAAPALPDRRHGHLRRQFLRRRDAARWCSSPTKATRR